MTNKPDTDQKPSERMGNVVRGIIKDDWVKFGGNRFSYEEWKKKCLSDMNYWFEGLMEILDQHHERLQNLEMEMKDVMKIQMEILEELDFDVGEMVEENTGRFKEAWEESANES